MSRDLMLTNLSTLALALVFVAGLVAPWGIMDDSLYRSRLGLPGDTARGTDFGINLPETVRATLARGTARQGAGERAYQSHAKAGRGDVVLPASTQVGIGEARWKSGESQLGVAAGAGQLGARFQGYAAARRDGSQGNSLAVAGAQVVAGWGQEPVAEMLFSPSLPGALEGTETPGEARQGGDNHGDMAVVGNSPGLDSLDVLLRAAGELDRQPVGTLAEMVSDRSGRPMEVHLTWYLSTGYRTRSGDWPFPGGVAVDPRVIPLGSRLQIVGDDRVYVANDTGGGVLGAWVDVFVETEAEGRALIREWGEYTTVEVMP